MEDIKFLFIHLGIACYFFSYNGFVAFMIITAIKMIYTVKVIF